MGDRSNIEWTEATWNPATGCTKVSPGCDHCYAETIAHRFAGSKAYPDGFAPTLRPERLEIPLRWTRPRRIFVCSMADLFHDQVPDEYIARVFAVMASAEQHTFQLLTKRHARMRALLGSTDFYEQVVGWAARLRAAEEGYANPGVPWPLPNVWVGVSTEDQKWAEARIPSLLDTPAAVRWISAEPLLGPIDLRRLKHPRQPQVLDALAGEIIGPTGQPTAAPSRLDWVVTGGESGRGARPMHPGWVRLIRDQCARDGVPFLHKQNGVFLPAEGDPRAGDVWVHGDGLGTTDWRPDTRGAEAGRWSRFADLVVRPTSKKDAGRELDGQTYDGYPVTVTA